LSPPWGGIKYKDSDVYSIKELVTPNIYDIVRVSLSIAKNIIFYLPRTLLLDELFEILSTVLNEQKSGSGDHIFFDVHILKSARKIKALMIIFGQDIKDGVRIIALKFRLLQMTSQNILSLTIQEFLYHIFNSFPQSPKL
jgi:hypothetical protein